jgi:hypothetical protein
VLGTLLRQRTGETVTLEPTEDQKDSKKDAVDEAA